MHSAIDVEKLLEIVAEVEKENPIDWGMLPIDENAATRLIALSIVEQFQTEWTEKYSLEELHYIMLATIVKLITENFVLMSQLYRRKGK